MTPFQKITRDPGFWTLLLLNLFLIYEYTGDSMQYSTIVWLYWCQSVLIGAFNFFDMLTLKNISLENLTINGKPATAGQAKGCLPFFFLFHYGIFHFVYLIFLAMDFKISAVDFSFLKWALLGLFANQLIQFVQNKTRFANIPRKVGNMFVIPYLRIVPMHLTILLPTVIGWTPALTFLILKTLFDLVSHIITTPYYWRKEAESTEEGGYI